MDIRETARRSAAVIARDTQALTGWSVAMVRKRALEAELNQAEMELGRSVRDLAEQGEMQHPVLDTPLQKVRDIQDQIRRQDEEMARLRAELSLRPVDADSQAETAASLGGDVHGTADVIAAGHGEHDRRAAAQAAGLEADEAVSPPVEGGEPQTLAGPESMAQSQDSDESFVPTGPETMTGREALAQSEGEDADSDEPPSTVTRRR